MASRDSSPCLCCIGSSSSVSSSPSVVVVTGDGCYAYQKREHANLVLSHPAVITYRQSRSSLCVERWRTCGLPSKSLAIARILTSSKHNTTTNLLPSPLSHIHLPLTTRTFIYSRAIVSPARTHFHKIELLM